MRDSWDQGYSDLLGPRRRCVWTDEVALFDTLTSPEGIPIKYRLIAREVLAARRISFAHIRMSDPAVFGALLKSWIRREHR